MPAHIAGQTCCTQCIEQQNSIGAAVSPCLQPASTLHACLAGGSGKQQQLSVPHVSIWRSPYQVLCYGVNSCATHLPGCQVACMWLCCVLLFTIVHSSSSLAKFLQLRNTSFPRNTGTAAGQAENIVTQASVGAADAAHEYCLTVIIHQNVVIACP